MLGAIVGDIVGSRFEFDNHRSKSFELFDQRCRPTDDSIMTLAVAGAISEVFDQEWSETELAAAAVRWMRQLGRQYLDAGYGGRFGRWLASDDPQPYNSFGNGAAMRVSPTGLVGRDEAEVIRLSDAVTAVSHNHPEGIKGARATALAVFWAKNGLSQNEIKSRIESDYYRLDFTIDQIRSSYEFNETCQETVPQAIECFLEATGFEDAIRLAISLGGDSDTVAAITGSIADAYWGVPEAIAEQARGFLDQRLSRLLDQWESRFGSGLTS